MHIDSARNSTRTFDETLSKTFDATLSLTRGDLTQNALARLLARYPLLTLRILTQIYANGVRLHRKGARYFPNPSGAPLLGGARRKRASAPRDGAAR